MRKIFTFLLVVAFTGIISEPEAIPRGIETTSVTLMKKVPLPRPFFRLENKIEAIVSVTAYNANPEDLNFLGKKPKWGDIAVDPKVVPLGSIITFENIFPNQKFEAVDIGENVIGWKFDIFMLSKQDAKKFGLQINLRATIQKPLTG